MPLLEDAKKIAEKITRRNLHSARGAKLADPVRGACPPKRFAYYVGRRCRSATIKDVADDAILLLLQS